MSLAENLVDVTKAQIYEVLYPHDFYVGNLPTEE